MLKTQIEESKMREDEVKRATNTIFMTSLPLKATEKDIYGFIKVDYNLQENNIGKVRDIKLIREVKTKRSKGIAYVEFYYFESVVNALSLNNKRLMGQNIFVTRSQSEKNRGQIISRPPKPTNTPAKSNASSGLNEYGIIIKNLVNELARFNKDDITRTFESFGHIEYIDMEINPKTKLNKGFAIVLYSRVQDAKTAIAKMNGYSILGEIMMVEHVPSYMCVTKGNYGEDGEEGGSKIASSKARMYMMNKFMRGDKIIADEIGDFNQRECIMRPHCQK